MGEKKDKFKYETQHLNINDISPENGKHKYGIGQQPWWFKLQIAGVIIGILIIIVGFVGLLAIPFEPFHFYGWKGIPEEVCPAQQIHTSTVSRVDDGPYTIGDVTGYASIVTKNKVAVDTWNIETQVEPHPKQVMPSSIIRTAPEQSGKYKLGINITINGRVLGIVPRYQELEMYSKQSFLVLSESAKQCKKT